MEFVTGALASVSPNAVDARWQTALAAARDAKKEANEQAKFLLDSAKIYQTTIFGLAYGGFFAIWAFSRNFVVDTRLFAIAGALMGLSLLLFVCFEITNMLVMNSIAVSKLDFALQFKVPASLAEFEANTQVLVKANSDQQERMLAAARRLHRIWPWIFLPALVFGVSAAGLLIILLLKHGLVGPL